MGEPAKMLVQLSVEDMRRIVREELAAAMKVAPANDDRKPLTTKQAAEYLEMSPKALNDHVRLGRLRPDFPICPGFKTHRFLRSTLDAFKRSVW